MLSTTFKYALIWYNDSIFLSIFINKNANIMMTFSRQIISESDLFKKFKKQI